MEADALVLNDADVPQDGKGPTAELVRTKLVINENIS